MMLKRDTDRDLRVGDLILTVVERASTSQTWAAHICTVVGFSGKRTDRVQVEPLCGVRGGMSSERVPLRECQRCAARVISVDPVRPLVWEQVITGSAEKPRFFVVESS